MPAVQNDFTNAYRRGLPGMVANGETSNRISRTNESVTPIPFGRFVFKGVGAHTCVPAVTDGNELGVSIADHGVVMLVGGTADAFVQRHNVPIMQAGVICVVANGVVAAGAQVAVLTASGNIVAGGTVGSVNMDGWFADEAAAADGDVIAIAKRIK